MTTLRAALCLALCFAPAGLALAADDQPRVSVSYLPPRLSVESHGASLARVLGEIGGHMGFAVVDSDPDSPLVSVSIQGRSVDEVLGELLQDENYAVVYVSGAEARQGSSSAPRIERIVLLGPRTGTAGPASASGGGARSFPASDGDRVPDRPTPTLSELLAAHAAAGASAPANAAGSNGTLSPSTPPEGALAESTRSAQQGLETLIQALTSATRSLQQLTPPTR